MCFTNKGLYILPKNKATRMNKELTKFFKDLFFIDVTSDVDSINFPTFEEVLGVLDLAEQKRESFKNYKSESYNDNNTSISYIRQSLIMLTAYTLNNANSRSNSYHKLLLENLGKQNMLQNTTFISANYDIHIDNAIASLYDANKCSRLQKIRYKIIYIIDNLIPYFRYIPFFLNFKFSKL